MAIITKPANVEKNSPATFTLSKSELVALSVVQENEYFSDTANWSKVILNYKSSDRNQFHIVTFDATQESPTGVFFASEKASDVFEIISINIVDFDNGIFRIAPTELVTDDFKIDYNANGSASTGTALLGISNMNLGMVMQLDASDPTKILITSNGTTGSTAGGKSTYHMVVDSNGNYNENYSKYLLDTKIKTYVVSDDGSKIWVVGQFNLIFNEQALPAYTTGTGFTSDQVRVLEIDTATGTITHKFDIPDSTDGDGMTYGVATFCMLIDDTKMYFSGNNYIACYNRTTGAKVWGRSRQIHSVATGGPKRMYSIVQSPSHIFCSVTSYNGDIVSNSGSLIKISKVDGTRDTTNFPTCPQLETRGAWAVSPDGTKAVMGYGYYGVTVLNGGTWTNYNIDISLMAISADNSKFYTLGGVVNSHPEYGTGSPLLSFDWNGNFSQKIIDGTLLNISYYGSGGYFAMNNGLVYISKDSILSAYNMTTGAKDLTFSSPNCSYVWGKHQFAAGLIFLENSDFAGNYPISTTGDIAFNSSPFVYFDTITKSVIRSQVINNMHYGANFFTSSLYPNKLITLSNPTGYVIKEYDLTQVGTMTPSENGWPQITGGATYFSKMIHGNYLYIHGNYGTTCGYSGTMVSALHRINIATKTLDTSWLPNLSSIGSQGTPHITGVTDTYVYVSYGFNTFYRFKLSDGSAEHITVSTLGLSDAYINDQKYNVASLGSGKIVLWLGFKGAATWEGARLLDGKSYIIYNEADWSRVTTSALTAAPATMYYNPADNSLSGITFKSSQYKMTKIDLTTDTEVSSPSINSGNGDYQFNSSYIAYYDTCFLFNAPHVYTSYSGVFNRRAYSGIVDFGTFPTTIA